MQPPLLCLLCGCLLCLSTVRAQIKVGTEIKGALALPPAELNTGLQDQGMSQASGLTAFTRSELSASQCDVGTYAEGQATSCTACAAGTASPVKGATTHFTCQACAAGGFSLSAASACTPCTVNTFSPTPAAGSQDTCQACPPNSNSGTGTDAITKCGCNDRFFLPLNVLQPLDPLAPTQFASWAGLALDTLTISVPHVNCV